MDTTNKIKVLVEKDGMKFIKLEKNKYNLTYSIENKNINLEPLVNFELIKLIYELNPDIYEKVVLNKVSEEEAQITLLMKHFFNDLGFPQKYSYMGLKKVLVQIVLILLGLLFLMKSHLAFLMKSNYYP